MSTLCKIHFLQYGRALRTSCFAARRERHETLMAFLEFSEQATEIVAMGGVFRIFITEDKG